MNPRAVLSSRSGLFLFWLPLAATWFLMSLEGPFLSAIIARLPVPKENLAAYGVAFSLAVLIESPIIMILSASNKLVRDRVTLARLFRFLMILNGSITLLMLVAVIPKVNHFLARDVLSLTPEVETIAHTGLFFLLPWPAAIGFRRFYHGLLISQGQTRKVAWGTIVRFSSMAATGFVLFHWVPMSGAHVGCLSLSVGVVMEAVATRWMASGVVAHFKNLPAEAEPIAYRDIVRFYTPLALTALISFLAQPIAVFFLGGARESLNSLAVLPVINSFMFLFLGIAISFQEAVVALHGVSRELDCRLASMARRVAWVLSGIIVVVSFTPLADAWFLGVSGLSEELARFADLPAQIVTLMPLLTVWVSFQRGVLVANGVTRPIGWATATEVVFIELTLWVTLQGWGWVGAVGAATAFVVGRLADNLVLLPANRALRRKCDVPTEPRSVLEAPYRTR